jgi:PKD repeat protein
MTMVRNLATAFALALFGFATGPASAQTGSATPGLLVVYGALAPSREGDVDRREQVFFSVPADLKGRIYVRIFDPEVSGSNDFTLGGTGNSRTVFRVFGGKGAYSDADRPMPLADGAREPRLVEVHPITEPGELLNETTFGNDRDTDGRWVNLTALWARQGEVIGDKAYFRIDVQGAAGDDGNGFSLDVSLSRDRNTAPTGLEMFAYRPTVRWLRGAPATQVWFSRETDSPLTIQSFDAANGSLALVTDYKDLQVRVSGQDFWTSDTVDTDEANLALSLMGGFETPNDVTLAVFDSEGVPIRLQMPTRRAPDPSRPSAIGSARALADCRSVAFDASGSGGLTPLSYLWEFGDGKSADHAVMVHRYDRPGQYTSRLRVLENGSRPGRGAELDVSVHVRNAPIAVPGADIVVAPGQMVDFDGTGSQASDSPITKYRWTFGDGTIAVGSVTQKAYATPGLYRAVLRVEDASTHPCNFGVETLRVIVNFPPVAEAGTDQSGIVGQPVILSAGSSYDIDGMIETYHWDMGDGTVLNGETVSHTYDTSGDFRVMLSVTDDSAVANSLARDHIRIQVNAPPVPKFTIPPRAMSVAEVATLDGSGSTDADGQILSYVWDFGDGAIGEGPVVNYAWTLPGVYNVVLTVIDDSATRSALQSVAMDVVVDAAPVANAGQDQFVTASDVRFDGGGSVDADGKVTSYEWDFGDGSIGSGQSLTHAYLRTGTYEVSLVVLDDSTAPLNTDRDTMLVTINASPIADAGPDLTVAPGEEFVLSGRGSVDPDGTVSSYVWEFPDGSTARGVRASHTIADPGLHRVRLMVLDDFRGGASDDQSEVLITVNAPPVAVAGADLLIAPGETHSFDAGQSYDPDGRLVSYRWQFDDLGMPLESARVERAWVTPGVWSVQLLVTDDSGVTNGIGTDDLTIRVNHPPQAKAGAAIDTDWLYVQFDGSSSTDADGDALIYRWDFGDGSAAAFGEKVTHVYAKSGIFPVTLRVDDGTGLSNARSTDATVVTVNARPVADAGDNRDVCSGEPILFDGSGSVDPDGGLLLYSWDFGDGSGSDLINPTKIYERPGGYPVTLSIQNETGSSHGSGIDRIAALVREGPIADAGQDMTVCTNQKVRFDGTGSTDADGAVNAFSWTFGDGETGSGETPIHVFRRAGTYAVTLTITGEASGACSPLDTDVGNVIVVAAPELSIVGPERAAAGLEASFLASLDDLGTAKAIGYRWDFGDGNTGEGIDVDHVFDIPGEYVITLTTELTGGHAGCSQLEIQRKVIVNAAPTAWIDGPEMVSIGQSVIYDASGSTDTDGAIVSFGWDFGDGSTARGVQSQHQFSEPGVYTVSLTITDEAQVGNSKVITTKEVTVNLAPVAGLIAPPPICPAVETPWSVTSVEGTSVNWVFGDGSTASGAKINHTFSRPGLFPVTVLLDDGAGLPASRRSEEIYVRVNSAPSALAGPDRIVCPGDLVAFDAGPSGDLDGDITQWIWDFSDGIVLEGQRVERAFEDAADLTVKLTVHDDSGSMICGTGSDTARLLVNSAPVVDAGPDMSVPVGAAHDIVRFNAAQASDPNGQGLRFSWSFGDGAGASGAVVRHGYSVPGTYTVTVRAQDTTGLSCGIGTDSAVITAVPRDQG